MIKPREIKEKIIKSQFLRDSFWALFGNIFSKGLILVNGIIIARILGKEIFGEYGVLRNPLMSSGMFLTLGLGYTTTKFISESKMQGSPKMYSLITYSTRITFIFSFLVSVSIAIFSTPISVKILEAPHLSFSLKLIAVWLVFFSLTINQTGILAGLNEFKKLSLTGLIVGVANIVLSFPLTYFLGLNGTIGAMIIIQIIQYCILQHVIENNLHYRKNSLLPGVKNILIKFSIPVALQEGVFSISSWLLVLLIIDYTSYSELGLYTAAMQWNAAILFIPGILRNVILTHFSQAGTSSRFESILKNTVMLNILSTAFPAVLVILFSKYIVTLYGQNFDTLDTLINLSVFSTVFIGISNVYSQAYMSKERNWLMLFLRILREFGTIALAFYFIYFQKSEGAWSVILSSVIMHGFFTFLMVTIYRLKLR